jgi:acetolactate synthase-1/2/3 large subunit
MGDPIHGGRVIARVLSASGVRHLFCLQGGHIDPILYGCEDEGIRVIDTRHEQAAAHMAEGWSRATGETGVCAVTAGPGLSDAVTGLANAYMEGSPMLCLAGARPIAQADTWPLQDLDQLGIVSPTTRWARSCLSASRIGEYTTLALAHARSGRPGPVYLDVPVDVLNEELPDDTRITRYAPPAPPAPEPKALERATRLLERAERPIVLAGSGAHWSRAGEALARLSEKAGLPILTFNQGRGVLPDQHLGSFNLAQLFTEVFAADAVLCLGLRLGWTLMGGKLFGDTPLIRVDLDAVETSRNRPGDINLVADARVFCEQLADGWEGGISPARERWADRLRSAAQTRHEETTKMLVRRDPQKRIHPLELVTAAVEVAGPEASFAADGGNILTWASVGFPAHAPGRILTTGAYLGCLGVGIPFALAAKLARPEHPVVLVEGDGSFGLNAMEFDTALRHDIPFVCVVANDASWGMSRHGQLSHHEGRTVATELGVRPYHDVVRALGGHGEQVEDPAELRPAIDRALSSGLPACVNVVIDPDVPSPFSQMMAGSGE